MEPKIEYRQVVEGDYIYDKNTEQIYLASTFDIDDMAWVIVE
jgi:hypothetical protein